MTQDFAQRALFLIPMIMSLTVHEWAHAWSAMKLGDDTALRLGRLTLNPIPHIDPVGTLLLPLLGIPFGWAKPVPVNPSGFRRDISMGTGMAVTAAAGPISNVVLAFGLAVVFGLLLRFAPHVIVEQRGLEALLLYGIQLNVGLALFNLLPIPPLDGSRIVERFVPYQHRGVWEAFSRFAPLLLIVTMATGGFLLAGPRAAVTRVMYGVIRQVAGV